VTTVTRKNSPGPLLSLRALVLLGVAAFCGISAAAPVAYLVAEHGGSPEVTVLTALAAAMATAISVAAALDRLVG
jgi:hypothetical protein